jgi:hypothetical protein
MFAPKLRISGLTKAFAECVGCFNITVAVHVDIESDTEPSVMEEEKESHLTDEEKQSCRTDEATKSVVDFHVASTHPVLFKPYPYWQQLHPFLFELSLY